MSRLRRVWALPADDPQSWVAEPGSRPRADITPGAIISTVLARSRAQLFPCDYPVSALRIHSRVRSGQTENPIQYGPLPCTAPPRGTTREPNHDGHRHRLLRAVVDLEQNQVTTTR
jgi:hypothetical protein